MLYLASDIIAQGGSSGYIQTIGFNIRIHVADPMENFTIKLKNTSSTSLSVAGFETGMTTVYSGTWALSTNGWNDLTLDSRSTGTGLPILLLSYVMTIQPGINIHKHGLLRPQIPNGFIIGPMVHRDVVYHPHILPIMFRQ